MTYAEFNQEVARRLGDVDAQELESLYRNVRRTLLTAQRHRVPPKDGLRSTMTAIGDLLEDKIGVDKFDAILDDVDAEFK